MANSNVILIEEDGDGSGYEGDGGWDISEDDIAQLTHNHVLNDKVGMLQLSSIVI